MSKLIEKQKIFSLIEPFAEKDILEKGQSIDRVDKMLPFTYLASGTVRVFMESDDEEKRCCIEVSEGEFLGETTYYDCDFKEIVVIALKECHIMTVPHENLLNLKKKVPEIEANIYESLGKKVRHLAAAGKSKRMGIVKRLAAALLMLSDGLEARYGDETWAILKCTREDVALIAKTGVSTATAELKQMQVNGILNSMFKRIEIRNLKALYDILEDRK